MRLRKNRLSVRVRQALVAGIAASAATFAIAQDAAAPETDPAVLDTITVTAQSREQIITRVLALPEGSRCLILAPVVRGQKGEYKDLFADMLKRGFVRARVDGQVVHLTEDLKLDRQMVSIFIFAILALALNVQVGYAGLLQLGIIALFAIGAITSGIFTVDKYPFQFGFWGRC